MSSDPHIPHRTAPQATRAWALAHAPGLALCALVAAVAAGLGSRFGAPVLLMALLLGMALHVLAGNARVAPGVEFSARTLLRLAVGLLGLRIALSDLAAFGGQNVAVVAGLVALTLGAGLAAGRAFGRPWGFSVLAGGAVAICGASAALAVAAVLPRGAAGERDVLFTVLAVTTLSTVAMVLYPLLFLGLGFDAATTGFLIGATIHDVAQVVGAGYAVSPEAGDIATITKLLRVALLPVVLVGLVLGLRALGQAGAGRVPLLPWFLVLFVALSVAGSVLPIPEALRTAVDGTARGLLVLAIAALGVKTSLGALARVGAGHMGVVVGATLALLGAAMAIVALGLTAPP
ncbi:MAG: YeiH family protein [Alkalilacustris sp.]